MQNWKQIAWKESGCSSLSPSPRGHSSHRECTSTLAFLCTPCPKELMIFRFNSREWKGTNQCGTRMSRLGSYSLSPSTPAWVTASSLGSGSKGSDGATITCMMHELQAHTPQRARTATTSTGGTVHSAHAPLATHFFSTQMSYF